MSNSCAKCSLPVDTSKRGYHQVFDLVTGKSTYYHWDCMAEYSAKIDAMVEDAHSDGGDGVVELGPEVAEKISLGDGVTHYHIEDAEGDKK